jgi:hypothetical protein
MADLSQLKIQTNIVLRTMNDTSAYTGEILQLRSQIETMKTDGVDEHDVKKRVLSDLICFFVLLILGALIQEECLAETVQMIPDCKLRLETALGELIAQTVLIRLLLLHSL